MVALSNTRYHRVTSLIDLLLCLLIVSSVAIIGIHGDENSRVNLTNAAASVLYGYISHTCETF